MKTAEHDRNNLDFFRLFFAILVIYSHSFPFMYGFGLHDREPFQRLTHHLFSFGDLAVDFFFIISGYLISASWLRSRSGISYFRKRALRIFPAYIAAATVSIAVLAIRSPLGAFSARDLFSEAVWMEPWQLPTVFLRNPFAFVINGSVWTIRYELVCYIIVAACGVLGLLNAPWKSVVLFMAATLGLPTLAHLCPRIEYQDVIGIGSVFEWSRLIVYYCAGIVLYQYRELIPFRTDLFGAALLIAYLGAVKCTHPHLAFPITAVGSAYMIYVFGFSRRLPLKGFGRFGDFSYGTYLYAFPVQQIAVEWWGKWLTPSTLFLISAPVAVCCAILSWYCVEAPFLKLKASSPSASSSPPKVPVLA